jgi:hypothetical protein
MRAFSGDSSAPYADQPGDACRDPRKDRIGSPVYLDALEDAANYERALFQVLEQELTTATARSIPWRLACRPAAWHAGLAVALKNAFPDFRS